MKVFVPAHDHESMVPSVGPNCPVRRGRQPNVTDMDGTGVQISQRHDKTRREILVEQQAEWPLRQPGYSRPDARAQRRTPGRRECHRA